MYVYRTVRGVYAFFIHSFSCELTKYDDQEFAVHASYTKRWFGVRVPYCTRCVPGVYAFFAFPKKSLHNLPVLELILIF